MKKLILMGRAGAGKDYLAARLRERGISIIRSCTNRPRRFPDEDTHIFLSDEEMTGIAEEDKLCKTVVNGFEYFFTDEIFRKNQGCILDIPGFYEITGKYPETEFLLVYISANPEKRAEMVKNRGSHISESMAQRETEESEAFDRFEAADMLPENVDMINIVNSYDPFSAAGTAMFLEALLETA